jgi:hypothetical protein
MKKKNSLQKFLNKFPTRVSIADHDIGYFTRPKTMIKQFKKQWGVEPVPALYHSIGIQWSEKGRGFGEYRFWQNGDKIFCDNECDSKKAVKRILCQLVDQAIFTDDPKNKEAVEKDKKEFHAALKRQENKNSRS